MRRILAFVASVVLGAVVALVPAQAHAAGYPWHIKNSLNSNTSIYIYGEPDCDSSGSVHLLTVNGTADSVGWDCVRVFCNPKTGPDWEDDIFDDKTGALLATRTYNCGEKAPNLSDNDHLISVFAS